MDDRTQPSAQWSSRRILVTGANGFVGRWLVRALADAGAQVWALVRIAPDNNEEERIKIVSGDITDLNFLSQLIAEAGIDTVYHLAATNINTGAGISPYQVFETNIRGVYTVLEACRIAPKPARAIIASSKEVEDCFLPNSSRPHHPYMASKAAAELVTRAFGDTFGLPVVLVRSDNLYGGADFNWSRLVPSVICSILRGETPVIRSNGLFRRDYVYIEDAVTAYLTIGARLHENESAVKGKLFRIATGTKTNVLEMVNQISRVAGMPNLEPRVLNEKTEERVDSDYDPEFERTVLGWSSRYSLTEGLSRTFEWYRSFLADNPQGATVHSRSRDAI